jgi:hypothetical protein
MLTSTETLEVSNVRRAANRKRYAITKSEANVMKDPKIIQAVLSTAAEGEEQLVATMKSAGADEKRIEAATALYRLNKGFADVLKPEDLKVLIGKAHEEPDGDEQGDDESDVEYKARMAKRIKKARKSADAVGGDADAGLDPEVLKRVEAVMKSNENLVKEVQGLKTAKEQLEYVAKAEREFKHVPGSPAELAVTLKAAHDAGPEAEKTILAHLRSVEEISAKSALFGEIGTSGGGAGPTDANAKIQALAEKLTMKADSGKEMTPAQKYSYVLTHTPEGRALYREYLAQHPQQRAATAF